MLKSLADFFRGVDWTESAVESFDEMLEIAERNFVLCADHLVGADDASAIRDELYDRDRDINARERDIRRRVISHLAASPSEAHEAIAIGRETMRHCENAIREIAYSEGPVSQAVALVLIGRHYKRICAHLVNIATSVVMPADSLDYYDEKTS